MKIINQQDNNFFLRFDRGEEVLEGLASFCKENKIFGGALVGIGAASKVILAFYNPDSKEYTDHNFDDDLEIINITGNIALFEGEPMAHIHGIFGDREMKTVGGHVKSIVVSATCEISLQVLEVMKREVDPGLNLKLLK